MMNVSVVQILRKKNNNKNGESMVIPGTPRGIIKYLMNEHRYCVKEIAQQIAVTPKTIYQILKHDCQAVETDVRLINLYIQVRCSKADISLPKKGERVQNILNG